MNEKTLVEEYRKTYDALAEAQEAKKAADSAFQQAKAKLIENLEARDATATAKYDGIGRVSLGRPDLFAQVDKANEDILFSYLKGIGRADLLKETVHWKTLSSFAGEMTQAGKNLPEFIKLSFKKVARLTK